jgi:hypothetical protein
MTNTNDYKEWFQYPIDDLTIGRIKAIVSEAIIRKGDSIKDNAYYIGDTLKAKGLGVWLVIISKGVPKMYGYKWWYLEYNYCGYLNSYEYFGWNYFFVQYL